MPLFELRKDPPGRRRELWLCNRLLAGEPSTLKSLPEWLALRGSHPEVDRIDRMSHDGLTPTVLLGRRFHGMKNRFEFLVHVVGIVWKLEILAGDPVNVDIQRCALDKLGERILHCLLRRQGQVGLPVRVLPVLVGMDEKPDRTLSQVLANQ